MKIGYYFPFMFLLFMIIVLEILVVIKVLGTSVYKDSNMMLAQQKVNHYDEQLGENSY
jgi:hypothetical protein